MPVPSSIDDLSATASANYPSGTESPNTADDYFRAHAGFIASLRDSVDGKVSASDLASSDPAKGAAMVGADDGSGGSLWTTIAGFISKIISSAGSSVVGFIQAGAGALARTLQDKLRETVSIKDFGVKGDGTDETTKIQAAINYAAINGLVLNWANPVKYYGISSPLTVPAYSSWTGVNHHIYPNFTTDWQTENASWLNKCPVIQYVQGAHGAIFSSSSGGSSHIEGLVFRCGQARTSADCLFPDSASVSHMTFIACTFQNINHLCHDNTKAWGAWQFWNNQVIGVDHAFYGIMVDMKITANTFTSSVLYDIRPTVGAGFNIISKNRFEWGGQHSIILDPSRNETIQGNLFDAYGYAALKLASSEGHSINGNSFVRNGRVNDSGIFGSQSHVYLFSSSAILSGNEFRAAAPDGGGTSTPVYLAQFESCNVKVSKFRSNDTKNACTSSVLFKDRYGTSLQCIDADSLDLPVGSNANTASDDFMDFLSAANAMLVDLTAINVFENRKVRTYGGVNEKAFIRGIGAAITIDMTSGNIGFGLVHNVTIGGLAYSARQGKQYAPSQPNAYRNNGRFNVGDQVYTSAPTAGGSIGWVMITAGSPDVWKTFGAVSA